MKTAKQISSRRYFAFGLVFLALTALCLPARAPAALALTFWFASWAWLLAAYHQAGASRLPWALTRAEVLICVGSALAFTLLAAWDLNHWRYSVIGDEYHFYLAALDMIENGTHTPFHQIGVDGYSVLNSLYQAAVMAVFGKSGFGWRMGSVLDAAITLPGFYLLVRSLSDRRVAAFAVALLLPAHYLLAFAHVGKFMLHPIPFMAWSAAFFFGALPKANRFAFAISGILAGLGCYTLPLALVMPPLLLAFAALTYRREFKKYRALLPFAAGILFSLLPLLLTSGARVFRVAVAVSAFGPIQPPPGAGPLDRWLYLRQVLGAFFIGKAYISHFTYGSLLVPITSLLALVGGVLAYRRQKTPARFFFPVWFAALVLGVIVASPYYSVPVNRLPIFLLPFCFWAGYALDALAKKRARWAMPLAIALCVVSAAQNLYRFYVEMPEKQNVSSTALTLHILQSEPCRRKPAVVLGTDPYPLLPFMFLAYGFSSPMPVLLHRHAGMPPFEPGPELVCVVLLDSNPIWTPALLSHLGSEWRHQTATDLSGRTVVNYYTRAAR